MVNMGDSELVGLIKLPKNLGNKAKDFNIGEADKNKENIRLFNIIDTGLDDMPIFRQVEGELNTEYTYGFDIAEYFFDDNFWITKDEFKRLYPDIDD